MSSDARVESGAVVVEEDEEEVEEEKVVSGGVILVGTVPEKERLLDDEGCGKRSSHPLNQSWDGALGGYLLASNSSNRKSSNRREKAVRSHGRRGPQGPFYYIGGVNGAKIVSRYCEDKGWQRIHDQHRRDYKLKWCETKSRANYHHFREGHQLLYQIPNNTVLTTKIGLLTSLREYERVSAKVNAPGLRRLKMEQFIPDTFRLDLREERETFFAQQNGEDGGERGACAVWICKPTGMNQGRGIFLLKTPEDVAGLRLRLQRQQEYVQNNPGRAHTRPPQAHIAQRYVSNPLLLEGRKFDVRSYLLIACTDPFVVFFRHGYARLTCDPYDPRSNNLTAHLTNQCMQKKNPLYSELKEDTVWSMEKLNDYVNDTYRVAKALPRDWITADFARSMKQIMSQCFLAVKSKLDRKLGLFDLIGCDFLIDEDFKVWLLEMNCNPALHTNCGVLQDVVPSMLVEALDITLEIFSKRLCGQQILPLLSQRDFVLLHSAAATPTRASPPGYKGSTAGRTTSKQNPTGTTTKKYRPLILRREVTSHAPGTASAEVDGDDAAPNPSRLPEEVPPPSPFPRRLPARGNPCPAPAAGAETPPPKQAHRLPPGAAAGRAETPSTHVSGLPLKSPHSRAELRLNRCSWPPPEHFSPARRRGRQTAAATSPPAAARVLGEGPGGPRGERPGGALPSAPQATPSPHPGCPAWTGSQEKGGVVSEGGGGTGGWLPGGNRKGDL